MKVLLLEQNGLTIGCIGIISYELKGCYSSSYSSGVCSEATEDFQSAIKSIVHPSFCKTYDKARVPKN